MPKTRANRNTGSTTNAFISLMYNFSHKLMLTALPAKAMLDIAGGLIITYL
jgi:hypothetical protein